MSSDVSEFEAVATAVPENSGTTPPRKRLASLDLTRGATIIGMITVNGTDDFSMHGTPVFPVLLHASWAGFNAADAVFPAFITMVGVSIAVAHKSFAKKGELTSLVWRTIRLLLLGLFLVNMFIPLAPAQLWPPRICGVLQRIGIVFAVAALIYPRLGTSARAWLAGVILLAYWGICLIPTPDGVPVNLLAPGSNVASWIDRSVFGNWIEVRGPHGFDAEGLLSTIPTIAECLIGTLMGDLLRKGLPVSKSSTYLALASVAGIVLGIAWNPLFPIVKSIWTSSFVLVSAGLTGLVLAGFHALFDGKDMPPKKGGLLGSFGRNAIAAYTLHLFVIMVLVTAPFLAIFSAAKPLVGAQWAAVAPVLVFVLIIWIPMSIMDRRGWYWRI